MERKGKWRELLRKSNIRKGLCLNCGRGLYVNADWPFVGELMDKDTIYFSD